MADSLCDSTTRALKAAAAAASNWDQFIITKGAVGSLASFPLSLVRSPIHDKRESNSLLLLLRYAIYTVSHGHVKPNTIVDTFNMSVQLLFCEIVSLQR